MKNSIKTQRGYMTFTALLGIVLGLVMLFYPSGTMLLMESAFRIFQVFLSVFILYYAFTEAAHYFHISHPGKGILYILIGVCAALFVWIFNVEKIFFIIAFFLILSGLVEVLGSFQVEEGIFAISFLGIINIIVGVLILSYPLILPLLIAWFVLFWGISRFFLSLEIRRMLS